MAGLQNAIEECHSNIKVVKEWINDMSEANHHSSQSLKLDVANVGFKAETVIDALTTTKNQLNLIKSIVETQVCFFILFLKTS